MQVKACLWSPRNKLFCKQWKCNILGKLRRLVGTEYDIRVPANKKNLYNNISGWDIIEQNQLWWYDHLIWKKSDMEIQYQDYIR